MKKMRKHQQVSFINLKGAGRPAKHDPGIRHTSRPYLKRPASLHITIKILRNKADIKNKSVLILLKRAILNARRMGLRVIHFTLEFDHVHLLIETENNEQLGKGMQSFGVTLAKGINRGKKLRGQVYKHRYHFRQISNPTELKRVMNYIFKNGHKHKTAASKFDPFNSIKAEMKYAHLFGINSFDVDLMYLLDRGRIFFGGLKFVKSD